MNPAPHAAGYADRAGWYSVEVVENVPLAKDTWRLRFDAPEMARRFVPGQFLMLRLADCEDPLLGRPLALYDTVLGPAGEPLGVDVVYVVLGKMTSRLARFGRGERLEVWGPLGNGFPAEPAEHLLMVAGGIGQTPFMALAKEFLGDRRYGDPQRDVEQAGHVTLCYGVRRREYLAGLDDFQRLGVEVRISTDDGSAGHHGFVTDVLRRVLESPGPAPRIVACGPLPMMKAVAEIAAAASVPCQVSLETPMACGIGICFTCVAKVRDADCPAWDYRRTCVEGPIFDAARIVWD